MRQIDDIRRVYGLPLRSPLQEHSFYIHYINKICIFRKNNYEKGKKLIFIFKEKIYKLEI